MKTVPLEYSATFVSLAQSMQYLADYIGLGGALLLGFVLFLRPDRPPHYNQV